MFSLMHINIALGVYVVPTILAYLLRRWHWKVYVPYRIEHSYWWGDTNPSAADLFYIFFPVFNIIFMIHLLFDFISHMGKIRKKNGKTLMEKFFKL